jgi:hypothetical protein
MTNKVNQEYTANNQNPLILLTNENGKPKDLIGHLVKYDSQKIWAPYKVGDELDFEPLHRCYPKFVETGHGKFGSIDKELQSSDGLLFVLADGDFSMGCGARFLNTVFAVKPGETEPDKIAYQVFSESGVDVELKASGRINLLENALNIYKFSEDFYKNPRAYLDAVAGLVNGYGFKKGTPIFFKANLGK